MEKDNNIHPIFDSLLQREDKEKLLKQRGKVLWLTGLSGSGKSTIAQGLESLLYQKGLITQVLDGDNIRSGLNSNLGFSLEDRDENIRRIAEVAKLFAQAGILCINSFVSPLKSIRQRAKEIIGEDDFLEIYINAPLSACEDRDVKGLYAKARAGRIKGFTGIDSPYEAPEDPALEIRTHELSVEEASRKLFDFVLPHIQF